MHWGNCESGTGSARNDNGDLYYGTWVNGRPHGLGTVYFDLDNTNYSPCTFFTGRFAYGLVDGMGTFDFPGEKRMTVKYDKSQDLAVFEDVGRVRPRKRRHVLDDVEAWEGWRYANRPFSRRAVQTALWWISTKIGTVQSVGQQLHAPALWRSSS